MQQFVTILHDVHSTLSTPVYFKPVVLMTHSKSLKNQLQDHSLRPV